MLPRSSARASARRLAASLGLLVCSGAALLAQTPRLDRIEPNWGVASGGTRLVLRGAGFAAPGAAPVGVEIGGVAASEVQVVDDATLACRAPAAATTGNLGVLVRTSLGETTLAGAYFARPLDPPVRILPLGDSITESLTGYASYRYYLWHLLQQDGFVVDFTGTRSGVASGPPLFSDFDQQHQAISGMFTDQALIHIQAWIAGGAPEVALIHLGTNDCLGGQSAASTIAELGQLIDLMRAVKPDIAFLVAQILPHRLSQGVPPAELNALIPALAAAKHQPGSPVLTVDQFTGFSTAEHLRDNVHPNHLGEQRLAARWHAALRGLLIPRAARFSAFGQGCSAGAGALQLASTELARIGGVVRAAVGPLPTPRVPLFVGVGAADLATIPLPLDLTPFGAPSCALLIDALGWFPVDAPSGAWEMPVPNELFLTGARFTQQVLALDPTLNALGLATSSAGLWTLGDR